MQGFDGLSGAFRQPCAAPRNSRTIGRHDSASVEYVWPYVESEETVSNWLIWALLSACFAALTAIFAKVGVQQINSDVATFIRTLVILILLGALLLGTGQYRLVGGASGRTWLFLILSGGATGASWLCYFRALQVGEAARVAPIDKLSVVLVAIFSVTFLGEKLGGVGWIGIALIAAGAWLVTLG